MGLKMNVGHWRMMFCVFLFLFCWSSVRADVLVEEVEEGDEEEGSPEYLWQFQELLRCTMGIDGIMDLLAKYNCSECQRSVSSLF